MLQKERFTKCNVTEKCFSYEYQIVTSISIQPNRIWYVSGRTECYSVVITAEAVLSFCIFPETCFLMLILFSKHLQVLLFVLVVLQIVSDFPL